MNQTDFLKFLSSNNLNGAYHVGKQVLNNYSLPEAVSLFGQQEDGIYNAYDLLKFKPERVRINCGATGLVKTSRERIDQTETFTKGRGEIRGFHQFLANPSVIVDEDYFLIMYNWSYDSLPDMYIHLSICPVNIPNDSWSYLKDSIYEIYDEGQVIDTTYFTAHYVYMGQEDIIPKLSTIVHNQFQYENTMQPLSNHYLGIISS